MSPRPFLYMLIFIIFIIPGVGRQNAGILDKPCYIQHMTGWESPPYPIRNLLPTRKKHPKPQANLRKIVRILSF